MEKNQPKVLSSFSLALISVAAIVNLRGLPLMASEGMAAISFYLLAALLFLIPSALICAELSSRWPEAGGMYLWIEKAFGKKTGFFAIWSEWINNVISFPTTLVFIATILCYLINPQLIQHKILIFSVMLIIIWLCTFYNLLGIKAASRLNIIGALLGTIFPALFIIVLAIWWLGSGHHAQIHFAYSQIFPAMHMGNLVFFISVLSGYAGMQITAFHAPNVLHPQSTFPKGIALAVIIIVIITVFPSLAIAIVVPSDQLNLVSGVIKGFDLFLQDLHLIQLLFLFGLLIALSAISELCAWLLGPARGLAVAARQGCFPKWCAVENNRGVPSNILLLQAVIVTLFSLLFLYESNITTAFWLLFVLTSQFTLVMYILIFAAAIKLRYLHPNTTGGFMIPGGKASLWLIAGISILICSFGLLLSYFPPAQIKVNQSSSYRVILIIGDFLYIIIPIILYKIYASRFIMESELKNPAASSLVTSSLEKHASVLESRNTKS